MDWQPVYQAYPVNRDFIWLNNCGTVPAGEHILKRMNHFLSGYAHQGVFTDAASYAHVKQRIKSIVAGIIGCSAEELAIIHHTAEGMNYISHGLNLEPNSEILLLENEYPSNVYPWLHWKEKGVTIKTIPMERSPERFLSSLKQLINEKTRAIAISGVHWCTGMPLPVHDIGSLCRNAEITFVLDGAQTVGMKPLNVKQDGIDYMAFSAWKWLMGPLGSGMMYVSGDRISTLKPIFIGTESVVDDDQYLPYKSELKPNADRFTISTGNFNDWVYWLASLEFLETIGFDIVRERIYELSRYLTHGLKNIGFQVCSDQFPDHPSGIVVCEKPEIPSRMIMDHLKKNRVVAAERLGKIRFSPHIYNSFEQLDGVVRILEKISL